MRTAFGWREITLAGAMRILRSHNIFIVPSENEFYFEIAGQKHFCTSLCEAVNVAISAIVTRHDTMQ